jgi:hypothetical protein
MPQSKDGISIEIKSIYKKKVTQVKTCGYQPDKFYY